MKRTQSPYNVVFVLGGPGCGKGTQCAKISEKFKYAHISAGDLLRAERDDPNSKLGKDINQMMLSGSIVPSEVTCSLLDKAMAGYSAKGTNHFLIDGFPRNEENWKGWQSFIGNKANIQFVLSFVCPPDVCVARCLDRGKTSGRADDNAETLKKRLQQFETEGKPVIDDFRKKKLLKEIDACGSADEVFAAVSKLFAK